MHNIIQIHGSNKFIIILCENKNKYSTSHTHEPLAGLQVYARSDQSYLQILKNIFSINNVLLKLRFIYPLKRIKFRSNDEYL